jgi:hypothetical protein
MPEVPDEMQPETREYSYIEPASQHHSRYQIVDNSEYRYYMRSSDDDEESQRDTGEEMPTFTDEEDEDNQEQDFFDADDPYERVMYRESDSEEYNETEGYGVPMPEEDEEELDAYYGIPHSP